MQNSSNDMVKTRSFRCAGETLWRVSRGSKCTKGCCGFARAIFLGKQRSSCSDARKGQTCFPILMGKLILGLPWLSFLGGQRIPMSHIPSTHRAALIRDTIESGSSLSNTDFEPGMVEITYGCIQAGYDWESTPPSQITYYKSFCKYFVC